MGIELVNDRIPLLAAEILLRVQAVVDLGADHLAERAVEHMGTYPPASSPGSPPAKRTGDYAASITPHHGTGVGQATVTAAGRPGLFLEYGTVKMAARPHLMPAVELTFPEIIEAMKGIVG